MRVALIASGIILLSAGCAQASGELSGRRAPGFSLPDMNLQRHDLYDYRGRVVVLEVMQTTCPICQRLAPLLEKVKQSYGDKLAVLSIVPPPDNQTTVGEYIAKFSVTSPILFDCGQVLASFMNATPQNPTFHVPHVFLIDRDGMIRNDFHFGEDSRAMFESGGLNAEIDKLLAPVPTPARKPKKK